MKVYAVGGQVRDKLLGLEPKDLDYVVVGSTPEEMIERGFKQVGSNFPVFLHPETGDEYALARTEKSTGTNYQDFDCYFGKDVTIEDDLYRRDLTINAIAKDLETGEYIDPFGGKEDIRCKRLHPVSDHFSEDPVRVLRVARFLSIYPEFTVTVHLVKVLEDIKMEGMLDNLTPERVWKETEKALRGSVPGVFFNMLSALGVFSEISSLWKTPQNKEHHPEGDVGTHTLMVMDYAARSGYGPEVVFAGLCHDFGKPVAYEATGNALSHETLGLDVINDFCDKWKVPNKYRELALLVCEYHTKIHGCLGRGSNKGMRPKSIMKLLQDTNAIGKPIRFINILKACESDAKGRGGDYPNKPYPQRVYLMECLEAVTLVNTKAISNSMLEKGKSGIAIGEAIRIARIDAIRKAKKLFIINR